MVHSGNRATSIFQEGAQLCSGFALRVEGASVCVCVTASDGNK